VKIKELLEDLKAYDPEEEIIIGYWTKDLVNEWIEDTHKPLTDKQWKEVVDEVGLDPLQFEELGDSIQEIASEQAEELPENPED
jgi:hypothetical protein